MLGTIFYHIFYVLSIGFMRKNKFFYKDNYLFHAGDPHALFVRSG